MDLGNPLNSYIPQPECYDEIVNEIKTDLINGISPITRVLELGCWDGVWAMLLLYERILYV